MDGTAEGDAVPFVLSVVESGCIICERETRFCKTKTGQASIQEGKSDDTKRAGRSGSGAKADTTPAGTATTGKTAGRESKTTSAGTVTTGAGTDKESKTASTGTTEIGAGTGGETKIAATGRARKEKVKV